MALRATWQSHADPREYLRGTEVTFIHIYFYYISYSTYKRSIEELADHLNPPHIIYPIVSLKFLRVGLLVFLYFDFRRRGSIPRVGSIARKKTRVDAVDARST